MLSESGRIAFFLKSLDHVNMMWRPRVWRKKRPGLFMFVRASFFLIPIKDMSFMRPYADFTSKILVKLATRTNARRNIS